MKKILLSCYWPASSRPAKIWERGCPSRSTPGGGGAKRLDAAEVVEAPVAVPAAFRFECSSAALRSLYSVAVAATLLAGCASEPKLPETETRSAYEARIAAERVTADKIVRQAAATPATPLEGDGWKSLFDGRTLTGWSITDFGGHGDVYCEAGTIVLGPGTSLTGIVWTNGQPKINYEMALEAARVEGSDFFCGLTFPVGDAFCSLIVGGWGGSVVGLSSIDGMDASENETTRYFKADRGRWYRIRLRVTTEKIEAWIDGEKLVDLATEGRRISLRAGEIDLSKPFGLAAWQTTATLRDIKMRRTTTDGAKALPPF